jgi:hypothetical protein
MVTPEEGKTLTYRAWHQELELLLIAQGLSGARETAITKHFTDIHDEAIIAYLELLLKEDKVQKFKYLRNTYWRATVNILNEAYRAQS